MADSSLSPSQQQYPSLDPHASTNGNGTLENAKSTVVNSKYTMPPPPPPSTNPSPSAAAQQAKDGITNTQAYQDLSSGPVAETARNETAATKSEFSNLAAARQTPSTTAANGQNLTHYHSLFYNLLSWENPRATAISYAAIVVLIFATRYVPLVKYCLKLSYMVLGAMAAIEIGGKMVLGEGFATKMRPKKYYTVPRETLESVMEDLVELANFFVIEFQRIVFAENVYVTIGMFTTALITYFLIKVTPAWGLALLFTTLAYFVPLAYIQNRELVDHHLSNASEMVNKQTEQIRTIAAEHTNKAMEASQGAIKTYGARASEMVGQAKKSAVDKGYVREKTAAKVPGSTDVKKEDFPAAPTGDLPQRDGVADTNGDVKKEEEQPLFAT